MYKKALQFAYKAHKGQKRHDGTPYIVHPIRVANAFEDDTMKCIAVLHDVIEDTNVTYEEVEKEFGDAISVNVRVLTKHSDIKYFDYIKRVSEYNTPTLIKIADIIDNLSDSKQSESMIERYEKSLEILLEII